MPATIDVNDIPADIRKQLGVTRRRPARSMTMDKVRSRAIDCLAVLSSLTQAERSRVLKHATKLNEV